MPTRYEVLGSIPSIATTTTIMSGLCEMIEGGVCHGGKIKQRKEIQSDWPFAMLFRMTRGGLGGIYHLSKSKTEKA